MRPDQKGKETFEEVYPRHPFSELVRLGILLGEWIAKARLNGRERHRQPATRKQPHRTWLSQR